MFETQPLWVVTLLGIILLTVFRCVFVGAHRLLFHPLRAFPGPTLAAVSVLYRAYYQIIRDGGQLKQWNKLHDRYGPVIRIAPNQLHFSNPIAFEQIYTFKPIFIKDDDFYSFTGQSEVLFGLSDENVHKERFKLVADMFTPNGIRKLEPFMYSNTSKFCSILSEYAASGTPVNMALAFRALVFDVMLDFTFDETPEEHRALNSTKFDSPYHLTTYDIMDWTTYVGRNFPAVFKITPWFPERLTKALLPGDNANTAFVNTTQAIVESRLQSSEWTRDCFLARFPRDWPINILVLECQGSLLGGVIDTANVLQYATFRVSESTTLADDLDQEITRCGFSADKAPDTSELARLPLLTGVIKESLRLTHGIITGPPRVTPANGAIVDGVSVPPGTIITTSSYYSHMDAATFIDPENFIPARWEHATPAMEKALSAFSRGRRACPARNLAMTELYIIFATLFTKFRFEAHNTKLEDFEMKAYVSGHFAGPPFHALVRCQQRDS